ncbi:hypothetical protein JTE90_027921 [Oedothorax gibbosus]|uniref:Uncharacterized protein n=1 Tax=Oedothorax gibbosus TaxID=931172 RepID=A0AAV6VEP2_9ARAC|nr:hypothetical protein JTE90_027921 [Oedothorax gibbosus]
MNIQHAPKITSSAGSTFPSRVNQRAVGLTKEAILTCPILCSLDSDPLGFLLLKTLDHRLMTSWSSVTSVMTSYQPYEDENCWLLESRNIP